MNVSVGAVPVAGGGGPLFLIGYFYVEPRDNLSIPVKFMSVGYQEAPSTADVLGRIPT